MFIVVTIIIIIIIIIIFIIIIIINTKIKQEHDIMKYWEVRSLGKNPSPGSDLNPRPSVI